jgi:hypothetical protein
VDKANSTHGTKGLHIESWWESQKERNVLGNPSVSRILKGILKK